MSVQPTSFENITNGLHVKEEKWMGIERESCEDVGLI
jgi:hypothetical protein